MSYERLVVVGNVGKVEPLTSGQGNTFLRMSVAVNRGTGERKKTVWYTVLLFAALAREPEKVVARYRPGRLVLVEGRPQSEVYLRGDGSPEIDNAIVATGFPELLDKPPQ